MVMARCFVWLPCTWAIRLLLQALRKLWTLIDINLELAATERGIH